MSSPTQRSLALMRERGYYAEVVERRIPHSFITRDFAGFIDILCLKPGEVCGVQCTSASNLSARVAKIAEHENVGIVREAGIRILAQGWRKNARGRWVVREVDVS